MPAILTEGTQADGMMRRMAAGGIAYIRTTARAPATATGSCGDSEEGMKNPKAAGWTVPNHLKPAFGEAVRPIL